jgi:hypothetical protein
MPMLVDNGKDKKKKKIFNYDGRHPNEDIGA